MFSCCKKPQKNRDEIKVWQYKINSVDAEENEILSSAKNDKRQSSNTKKPSELDTGIEELTREPTKTHNNAGNKIARTEYYAICIPSKAMADPNTIQKISYYDPTSENAFEFNAPKPDEMIAIPVKLISQNGATSVENTVKPVSEPGNELTVEEIWEIIDLLKTKE